MRKDLSILQTAWFCTALLLLLLNDFFFKAAYANGLTGKLSDFAGLFILPLFFSALLPQLKKLIFLLSAVFFIYWKSVYSQPAIDLFNSLGLLNIGRVVDYTDLIALLILPLAWLLEERKANVYQLRIPLAAPLLLSLFAFIATSTAPTRRFSPNIRYTFEQMPLDSFISALEPEINIRWNVHSRQNLNHEERINFKDSTSADFMSISKLYSSDTLVLDGYFTISNPSDSIQGIYAYIENYNLERDIVTVSLRRWDIKNHNIHEPIDSFPYEQEKEHIKTVFENLVVKPLNNSRGPNHSSAKTRSNFPFP